MNFISVQQATELTLLEKRDFGNEIIPFEKSVGRVLVETIVADRDFPPFDRVTMDGFAIRSQDYLAGIRAFKIAAVQYAGEPAFSLKNLGEAVEVMTGTPLPIGCDSVIRIEDCSVKEGFLQLSDGVELKKNIHYKGADKKQNDALLKKGHLIKIPDLAVLATVGKIEVNVKKLPKVAIVTSGDELVDVIGIPQEYQIRKSNVFAISACINNLSSETTYSHLPDELDLMVEKLHRLIHEHDVLILSGGVSAGKKDYMPQALEHLDVEKRFHKIQQRPGKPMWFGVTNKTVVFALPGNPVSAFMCGVRYVKPWLEHSLGIDSQPEFAVLSEPVHFKPHLTYFMQIRLLNENGTLTAIPNEGGGSGDLANLSDSDAFLELDQQEKTTYEKGQVFRVWKY
jgi:molybdopterin molybdotransferase